MAERPNPWKQQADCKFCGARIYRFVNRKPPGEWVHVKDDLTFCYLDERFDRNKIATPAKRAS